MGFRDVLPASLQTIVQNGLLDRTFDDALIPLFLWDRLADVKPWAANLGATSIMTRAGLMTVSTTPITGSDATANSYGFEQYSVTMDQFGDSIDTNMAISALALASKFLEDNKTLGINAAETINQVAANALYAAYGEGTSWATAGITGTALHVADASGFTQTVIQEATTRSDPAEGLTGNAVDLLVPVSGSNTLAVTIGGVANTVTGVAFDSGTSGPGTLTLGTSATIAAGAAVVSSIGPVQYRPSGRASANQLIAGDIATLSLFQSAVTRLRRAKVPTVGGAYQAHIPPETIDELFQDEAFQRVYATRADSSAMVGFKIGDNIGDSAEFYGRFAGIDWICDTEVPTGTNIAGLTVQRPIVAGQGALIKAPFEKMGSLVSELNTGSTVQIDMMNGVARILRAPLDRLGQVLSSTWSWIGGYTVGTDMLTGDSAVYKRAVVLEHV